jgi:hypothetical protein
MSRDRAFSLLFALTLGGTFVELAFLMNAMQSAPTIPDAATAHVVPLSDHGLIHYITPLQNTLFFWVLFPTTAVVISVGLFIFLADKFKRNI